VFGCRAVAFELQLNDVKDKRTQAVVLGRLTRLSEGLFGQTRSLEAALSEMKIDFGPGYRVYFSREGSSIVVVLCGGDKSTQRRDIERARAILSEWQVNRNGP
jgi:putative addiction module killer protein